MKLAIVKETRPEERRVAVAPATAARLIKAGWEVIVERSAGEAASFPDRDYEAAGAAVVDTPTAWGTADVVVKVRAPEVRADGTDEATLLREGTTLISFVFPAQNPDGLAALAGSNNHLAAEDCNRSNNGGAEGRRAAVDGKNRRRPVVEAAGKFGSFFTGQFTAAGKVPPAKVLIIGAGVAGLAAIGAAHEPGRDCPRLRCADVGRASKIRASVASFSP